MPETKVECPQCGSFDNDIQDSDEGDGTVFRVCNEDDCTYGWWVKP